MGRKNLPQLEEQLYPKWPDFEHFRNEFKEKQKSNFDQRHRAQPLVPLPEDAEVWIKTETETTPGRVITPAATPRLYIVEMPRGGQVHRNRAHLNPRASTTPAQPPTQAIPADNPTPNRIMTRSRAQSLIHPRGSTLHQEGEM